MILQALYDLAQRERLMGQDPNYQLKRVPWLVRVGRDGTFLGKMIDCRNRVEIPTRSPRGRPRTVYVAPYRWVPREPERTSGDYAFFLCDTSEYLFGMGKGARSKQKLANRFRLFREKVRACSEATHDEAVGAVLVLLDAVAEGQTSVDLPEDYGPSDLIAFVYSPDDDRLVSDRPAVRQYWANYRLAELESLDPVECLITGRTDRPAPKHMLLKGLPGGTPSGVALVSFNASAFESYGLPGNQNAPISYQASEMCMTALNRLLSSDLPNPRDLDEKLPVRHHKISSDTVVCFWAVADEAQDFCNQFAPILEANPEDVRETYRTIWTGRPPSDPGTSAFYALTLSGTQGRAIVRDWLESTVETVVRHLAAYFRDLQIVRNTPPSKKRSLPPQLPMRTLLRSLAPQGRDSDVPPHLAAQMVNTALAGTRFPMTVLHRALERMRAEIGRDDWNDLELRDARAALIKAVLIRNFQLEVKPQMDTTNKDIGYLLGRLLAVIERAQQLALGDVNATVIDRYFSGASATPGSVFPRLLKNMRHHISKARDGNYGGTAVWLDRQADEIASQIDAFPAFLPLPQQGLFILGYHHQRHALWQKKQDNPSNQ